MRFSATLSAIAIAAVSLASATAATSIAPRQAATNYVGYLATTFIGNDPNIFQHLSRGNDPTSFRALNGGKAVLSASGVGTGGVRDPYLASNGRDYFIIGTDLDIGKTDWNSAVRTGSRKLIIWQSSDLVTWSSASVVEVENEQAGMVWAPSAVWNGASFDVFWASRFYAADDTAHTGNAGFDIIRTASTTDFKTFSSPKNYIEPTGAYAINLIDQEFQKTPTGWVRFLKDEGALKVFKEVSSSPTVFGNDWTRVGQWVIDQVREGPASFADNVEAGKYHLWLDNYSGNGSYEPYITTDIDAAGSYTASSTANFPYGMRHGSVIGVTQAQYDALTAKYPN